MSNEVTYVDVCVVCAMADEAQAFLEAATDHCHSAWEQRTSPHHGYYYRFTTLQNMSGETLALHVSWLPRYGPQEMTTHLQWVLEEYRPRFAIMTGICAGDKSSVALGDLIVAERTFTYDSGKFALDQHGQRVHLHDALTHQLDANILGFVSMFDAWKPLVAQLHRPPSKRQQREWLLNTLLDEQTPTVKQIPQDILETHAPVWRRIIHELQSGPDPILSSSMALRERSEIENRHYGKDPFPYADPTEARCYIKPLASSSAVRSDDPFWDIQVPVRGAVAIELEGAAFSATVDSFPEEKWLIVKGVSDYADSDKDDSYRHYSCAASAIYALCFIRTYVGGLVGILDEPIEKFNALRSDIAALKNVQEFSRRISALGEIAEGLEKRYERLHSETARLVNRHFRARTPVDPGSFEEVVDSILQETYTREEGVQKRVVKAWGNVVAGLFFPLLQRIDRVLVRTDACLAALEMYKRRYLIA